VLLLLAFQTAYLKAHYPEAYMAALMSSVMNTKDRVPQYVAEARAMNIEVLPPDVNESGFRFTVVGETIRFGLSAVKNVGSNFVEEVIAAREKDGPFEDLFDLCARVDCSTYKQAHPRVAPKGRRLRHVGPSRAAMLAVHAKAVERSRKRPQEACEDQFSMFDDSELPPKPDPARDDRRENSGVGEGDLWPLRLRPPLRPVLHKLKKHTDTTFELTCRTGAVCGWGARDLVGRTRRARAT
jgi:DNA polymerase-3 subunit alpha